MSATRYRGLIETWRDRLPIRDDARIITLGEGRTPLVRLTRIPRTLPTPVEIYAKYEGLNPTGSFKDRGMTVAVTQAVDEGSRAIVCASTGNTSASAAAYAARAGLRAFVLIPDGNIALGKLAQAMMHGALVIQIRGNFDAGMRLVREVAEATPVTIVNSINPYRLQGQKTAAFEIVGELGRAPDYHCLPVGNAGNITACWMGYSESRAAGAANGAPRMIGYQAAGAAPFVAGAPVAQPDTVATAIRIGNPQSWDGAWRAVNESGGWFGRCSDGEILAAQQRLAAEEGLFCEPASAAALAGLLRDIADRRFEAGSVIAITLTGHGLKDPDIAVRQSTRPVTVDADLAAVRDIITGSLAI